MPSFAEVFKAVSVAMALAPDAEKMLVDLDAILHKYVGPDVDKLKTDLIAALKQYQS